MRAWRAASTASTRGHGGVLAEATKVSSGGECGGDGWVLTGGMAPLSCRFLGGLVSASTSSIISNSLVWEIITVGRAMALISPSETSCIAFSLLMCPARFGVLAGLVGGFWPTQYNLSCRHSLQNWPPTGRHYQGWQADWGALFDHPLVVRYLNLFCRS